MKISILVPCYNEEETIEIFYNEVTKYFDNENDYSIIFVNDGSKDKSLDIMKSLAEKDSRVYYVSFSRNFGKEAAMYAALEAAKKMNVDCAIQMDVDLQDPPALIPKMLEEYKNGYNLVITKQKDRKGQSKLKAFFSLAFYKVYAFVTKDNEMAKGARDYCLMDKKVIESFLKIKDYERFTKGIYHFVGFKTKMLEFEYQERVAGTTKWNFRKLFHYAVMGMREFSRFYEYIPKIFAWIAFFFMVGDITEGIVNSIRYDASFFDVTNWDRVRLDFFVMIILISIFYLIRLVYDVRKQVQGRPIYIEEESNIESEKKM